jgi:DNA-binding transcriptional MerR regulator
MNDEIERVYYTVQQAAEDVGVQGSKIRFWDDQCDIIKKRNDKNNRKISVKELLVFHKIKTLRRFMTMNGVKAVLEGDVQIKVNPDIL